MNTGEISLFVIGLFIGSVLTYAYYEIRLIYNNLYQKGKLVKLTKNGKIYRRK